MNHHAKRSMHRQLKLEMSQVASNFINRFSKLNETFVIFKISRRNY